MNRIVNPELSLAVGLLLTLCCHAQGADLLEEPIAKLIQVDEFTLKADKHLVNGYSARTPQGSVHVVVEIPAGTNAKWEVDSEDGQLKWEIKNGSPRIVQYLPYPGNYGMIPGTLLSKERGGDGDPLDVLVLGPALPRGVVVRVKLIGVLKFLDQGEQDDKLIAVMPDAVLGRVDSLDQLRHRFPGVVEIVETWFGNYKGPGVMEPRGKSDAKEANAILDAAITMFKARRRAAANQP